MLTIVAQFVILLSIQYNQELLKITLKEYLIFSSETFPNLILTLLNLQMENHLFNFFDQLNQAFFILTPDTAFAFILLKKKLQSKNCRPRIKKLHMRT